MSDPSCIQSFEQLTVVKGMFEANLTSMRFAKHYAREIGQGDNVVLTMQQGYEAISETAYIQAHMIDDWYKRCRKLAEKRHKEEGKTNRPHKGYGVPTPNFVDQWRAAKGYKP